MSQSTVNVRRTCRICDLTIMCVHRYPQGLVQMTRSWATGEFGKKLPLQRSGVG